MQRQFFTPKNLSGAQKVRLHFLHAVSHDRLKAIAMKNFVFLLILSVGFLLPQQTIAQLSRGGTPKSFEYDMDWQAPVITMPQIDIDKLLEEDRVNDLQNMPWRFAQAFTVQHDLNNSGRWTELPNGDRIWQLKFSCPGALSINFLYDDFYMPKDALLFVYSGDRKQVIGAFGSHNNRPTNKFATEIIFDEEAIIEYYEPAAQRGLGRLSVAQVSHGYRPLAENGSEGLNDAGSCQVNVNCSPEGDNWQNEKKSVARIVINGSSLCTGALINNTAQDCTPYFLTANHCIDPTYDAVTNPDMSNHVFYWNFERAGCANSGSVPTETTTGAIVKANTAESSASAASDFALLELIENPNDSYDVWFAGFDATGDPGNTGVGIHHPAGDAKKIATHDIVPESVVNNRYWRIYWSQTTNGWSVTEGGSSGSPLFNENKNIIGQLFGGFLGGQPNCSNPANDEGDYGKVSYSWENNGATDNRRRLKDWLDPVGNGTNQVQSGSASPCTAGNCDLTDAGLSNIQCNNNGTGDDDTDDFFTFTLNPVGIDLGATYTVSGPGMTTTTGTYGSPSTFSTQAGTAGNGNLQLTITDGSSVSCTVSFTIVDTGDCNDPCNIDDVNLSDVGCDDLGSDNPNDDRIVFTINPTGTGLSGLYEVTGARLDQDFATYGIPTTFKGSIGSADGPDLVLTVVDVNNPSCTFTFVVEAPGNCSGDCEVIDINLANVVCGDNGTPNDPSDDQIIFTIDPAGTSLGNGYSLSGVSFTDNMGTYGSPSTFITSVGTAGNGDLNLTLTDDSNATCTFDFSVSDPGTCAVMCDILDVGLSNIVCNDNGTPIDDTDDSIFFDLNPIGADLGTEYTVSGNVLPVVATYGSSTTFSAGAGSAGAGGFFVTVTDVNDPNCSQDVFISDPGSCSGSCNLFSANVSNISCDDNGTPTDGSDDFIVFSLNPLGSGTGGTYTVDGMGMSPSTGSYGALTIFSTQIGTAGGGNLQLTITDNADASCSLAFTLSDPGNCEVAADCSVDNVDCLDGSFDIQADGTVIINGQDLISYDDLDCSYSINFLSPRSPKFDCDDLGDNNVTFRIKDNNGDSKVCTVTVTINDPDGNCNESFGGGESMDGRNISQQIVLYPNPAKEVLNIQTNWFDESDTQVSIISQLGQSIKTWIFKANSDVIQNLKLSDIESGVYYLQVKTKETTKTTKFIKQ